MTEKTIKFTQKVNKTIFSVTYNYSETICFILLNNTKHIKQFSPKSHIKTLEAKYYNV